MKSDKPESQYDPITIEPKWPFDKAQGKQGYDHTAIESYWQGAWKRMGIYEPDLKSAKRPFGKTQGSPRAFTPRGKPFYNLMMFPYPSAEGLHVGNMYAFTGSDIYGRFKRMNGFDVFEPIGLDGFGIHSENYALKIGEHPKEVARRTEANFYRQLHATGNAYSWSNKLETYKSNYYKWTQWIFIQLFKAGLAYRAKSAVNWCPHCLTVLADEQVVDAGVCERCGTQVEKKELEQWFFRITKYAQKLLDGLEKIDWSEKVKIAQRNWLGKSEGVEILFPCDIEKNTLIPVFTTRADTIFGVIYLALAPEHPLVTTIVARSNKLLRQEITRYISDSLKKSEEERIGQVKQPVKTGIDTGFWATNPINGKKVPIFIADYVLSAYGTGAVMGVPAHDQRDWEFARKYKLEIISVVVPAGPASGTRGPVTTFPPTNARYKNKQSGSDKKEVVEKTTTLRVSGVPSSRATPRATVTTRSEWDFSQKAFTDSGVLVNSGKFNGLASEEGIQSIIKYLEMHHLGSLKSMWHLRDWIISRQRYWGPPIPMVHCSECAESGRSWFTTKEAKSRTMGISNLQFPISNEKLKLKIKNSAQWAAGWYPVPEEDLPVELPYIKNFKPTETGISPLAQDQSFVKVKCPECGKDARRETDVSDTFLDSAWYFLRYTSIDDDRHAWTPERVAKWLPVNMYIGGAEHSVLHLLYSRFLWKVFYDLGYFDFSSKGRPASGWDEPFTKFRAHGLLISKGAKMSKSKGNVVIPDEYIEKYGSDTLRCYLMFCGRFTQGGDFRDSGIEGMSRFLKRIWRLMGNWANGQLGVQANGQKPNSQIAKAPNSLYLMHKTIKKVTDDIESLDYNTAIAALMEWVNALEERSATIDNLQLTTDQRNKSNVKGQMSNVSLEEIETLLLLLAPFAPHVTEELWQRIKVREVQQVQKVKKVKKKDYSSHTFRTFDSIHLAPWPKYDPKLATAQKILLVVEVNGKVRDKINLDRGTGREQVKQLALKSERVTKYLGGKKIKRVIFIPDRLINFVI